MFYEKEETFINTEGFIKRTNKLIIKKKTNEGWKMLRSILKSLKIQYTSLNYTNNNLILFNSLKQYNFVTFISFHYLVSKKLNSYNILLTVQNQSFFIKKASINFKQTFSKTQNTKLKYLVDDFFTGGNDEYSKNSLVLSKCSKILRTQSTNFF
jgi:NADH dehydrogenase/NADH:ubiquinone oxidoreductase subunit G